MSRPFKSRSAAPKPDDEPTPVEQPRPPISAETSNLTLVPPRAAPELDDAPPPGLAAFPDPRAILESIGETLYEWDLNTDRLRFGPNAAATLGLPDLETLATGRAFAERLAPESESSRYEAIARAAAHEPGRGAPYQVRYGLTPADGQRDATIWIEDSGRWFVGADGRPAQAHGLMRVITDRYRHERQLAFQSRFDSLTGALNRSNLLEQTAALFAQAAKRKQCFAALLIGVENLFLLNRTYGYDLADQVIAGLTKRLRQNCREHDLIARYAGNKFALVLEGCDTVEMKVAANRLIEAVAAAPFDTSAGPVPAALRIGGVVAPRNGRAVHLLYQHAEEALDLARQPGKPRFVGYEPSMARDDSRLQALRAADEIVSALQDGRIVIALQPLVHAATGEPALYEALMRLRRPDGELVLPAALLPIAEKSGLIQMIDQRVMELCLRKLVAEPNLRLAINVSGQTAHGPDFCQRLRNALASAPDVAARLTIEITETCAIEDVDATTRVIGEIRRLGAKVAMDDFGAGHTSFKNLRRFAFDLIKIDGDFVQNLAHSADDRFFVRTLVDLARHVGIPVVAEWVEDAETAAILRDWGVEYLQGDFFGAASIIGENPSAEDPLPEIPATANPARQPARRPVALG
jgi:diguanylate cyclase (GGDEF)-like protein